MTAASQDFTIYAGDFALPIFQVKDGTGTPIDISAVSDITWIVQRTLESVAVLTKTLTGGGIQLVSGGTTGKFSVTILAADSANLTGYYMHEAKLLDDTGELSTVATGRMQVGRAPASTYSGDPSLSQRDAVRSYIGDTDPNNPKLTDPQIDQVIADNGSTLYAAAGAAMMLSVKYAAMVDKRVGDLSISYSQIAKNYRDMAADLRDQGARAGGPNTLYTAGISRTDMASYVSPQNPDAVGAFTTLDAFDDNGAIGGFMPPNTGGE